MRIDYILEIYPPGIADEPSITFQAETPFPSIHRGDIVNPSTWPGSQAPMKVLGVVSVEHVIGVRSAPTIECKTLIFTEEVENTRQLRTQGRR